MFSNIVLKHQDKTSEHVSTFSYIYIRYTKSKVKITGSKLHPKTLIHFLHFVHGSNSRSIRRLQTITGSCNYFCMLFVKANKRAFGNICMLAFKICNQIKMITSARWETGQASPERLGLQPFETVRWFRLGCPLFCRRTKQNEIYGKFKTLDTITKTRHSIRK